MGFSERDAELAAQARNFSAVLAGDPERYNQSPAVAAQVTEAADAFVSALGALTEARATGVRSEQMTAVKNFNRRSMLKAMRPVYSFVQFSVSISDEAKIALGVHVRAARRKAQAVPEVAPLMTVANVDGNVVTVRMTDPADASGKARPASVAGMSLFSFVGDAPPDDLAAWRFEANVGRVQTSVMFPASAPIGAKVWFCASFFNNRKQSGPVCTPVSARLGSGSIMPTATMKIAA